ncbi:MAG: sodium:calcium antiporter, partial [Micavibrio sp.]|nr:sodium:calcium antiporter [Micavibrio sp.]
MEKSRLSKIFDAVSRVTKPLKTPKGIFVLTALLGSTALMTPQLLSNAYVAGAILGLSLKLLVDSSDIFLEKARAATKKFNELNVGIALGAIAAIPDFGMTISSIVQGQRDLAIGALVGGNISHIFLIMGAAAAVAGGIHKSKGTMWKFNAASMAAVTVGFGGLLATDKLNWQAGIGLALAIAGYAWGYKKNLVRNARELNVAPESLIHSHAGGECSHGHDHSGRGHSHDHHDHEDHHHHDDEDQGRPLRLNHKCGDGHDHDGKPGKKLFTLAREPAPPLQPAPPSEPAPPRWRNPFETTIALAGLAAGSHFVIQSATNIAASSGFDKAWLGTFALALASSATELIITTKAARNGNTDMAIGNVLGCNISCILGAGTVLALSGTPVPPEFTPASALGLFNLAALGASATLMSATLWANKGGIKKWQGYAAVGLYAAFMAGSSILSPKVATEPPPVRITVKTPAPAGLPSPGQ